jgi:aspartyl-tRNA(Asn)/glutamyl-tRNA(Gln) amidotransferase subunit B
MNDLSIEMTSIPVPPEDLAKLIDMVTDKTISGNSAKVVLGELFKNGGNPEEIIKARNLALVSDEGFIQEAVTKILNDNPKEVEQYLAGKETILQWLMGQVAVQPRKSRSECGKNVTGKVFGRAAKIRMYNLHRGAVC